MIEHAYILYIDTPEATKYMEECKASCEEHGIPVTPFLGKKLPNTVAEIKRDWGWNVNPIVENPPNNPDVFNIWFKEQLCLTGHLAIWEKIAKEHKNPVAVFEHDAIVKRNFLDVEVNDREFVFLGYRVDHRDDYECIDEPFKKVPVYKFEGTHAYALTPWMANACIDALKKRFDYLPIGVSIDHMMGIQNAFGVPMYVVDPAPVIAAIEDKRSSTQPDEKSARYNMTPPDGFLRGLKNTDKYKYDPENDWLVF